MEFFLDNWTVMIGVLAAMGAGVMMGVRFFKLPNEQQMNNIREWLLWAVLQAEKELGTGTGQLKLSYVYDLFLGKFPATAALLSFARFSSLVDEALVGMKQLVESNSAIRAVIEERKK